MPACMAYMHACVSAWLMANNSRLHMHAVLSVIRARNCGHDKALMNTCMNSQVAGPRVQVCHVASIKEFAG